MSQKENIRIGVVGGGHAGVEASLAISRMGKSCYMITMSEDSIGRMSCNPAIGGLAKGHLVREIDAMGGIMGRAADKCAIQFKTLNKSKKNNKHQELSFLLTLRCFCLCFTCF